MNFFRWPAICLFVSVFAFVSPPPAIAQVSISIDVAPPPLIVEDQPPIPDDGYIWTPGYWAYDQDQGDYYWVPGAWVQPPEPNLYWTPDYWSWDGNDYVYNQGYWGPTVGFYGGINYGYGYWGDGYGGGRWNNGHFDYNTAANNVSGGRVHDTYADRSAYRPQSSHVSFNGGKGGVQAQPTAQEREASQQNHVPRTAQQQAHFQTAAQTRSHQVKVSANKPDAANASQPTGSGAAPYTGQPSSAEQKPEEQKPAGAVTSAPSQPESPDLHDIQPKSEEKPIVKTAGESSPAEAKPEEKPLERAAGEPSPAQVKPEEKPAHEIPHPAPPTESHAPQGPGGGEKPHVEAKPQAAPAPAPGGGGKPPGPSNNGH